MGGWLAMHFLKASVTPQNIITPNFILKLFFSAHLEVHFMIGDIRQYTMVSCKFIREKAVQGQPVYEHLEGLSHKEPSINDVCTEGEGGLTISR